MNFTQFSKTILEKCPEVLNLAWKPVQGNENASDKSTGSKFGGADPFRSKYFQWPKCSECGKQKEFICQINIKNLPEKLQEHIQRNTGIFQCFFCLHCMPCDGCFEDIFFVPETELFPSLQSLASRFIFQNNISTNALPEKLKSYVLKYNEVFQRSDWEGFDEKNIKEWIELKREVPGYEELTGYGEGEEHVILTKTGLSRDELLDMDAEGSSGPDVVNAPIQFPASGIKLGGYVRWCQGVEYPTCPDCQVPMSITFLQMEDDNLFPFLWGDCGTAHVTLCPDCGRPGLGWACC